MNLTVYLLRHGQTIPETPWRFLGQRDVPLSDAGRAQAAAWRDALSGVDFAGACCSDLARCRDTAAIILEGRELTATPVAELREISLGEWDGLSVADVKSRYPGLYEERGADIAGFRPPGGESFADLSGRAWTALGTILATAETGDNPEANLLVVAHAGVNRTIMARVLGMPLENLFRLDQDHGCLNILRFGSSEPRLVRANLAPGTLPG
ncbi:histidine phosphatase family protein [Fundidesulfovibrio putealis]|uniref:histidine phosphatase family protein n=1 Tax=Fundidesulfovibrio putealis TaxID=270496 RepID=UPI00041FAD99|nr:histidine phosphatase family protein [Fundidesulfovibrio putealis]